MESAEAATGSTSPPEPKVASGEGPGIGSQKRCVVVIYAWGQETTGAMPAWWAGGDGRGAHRAAGTGRDTRETAGAGPAQTEASEPSPPPNFLPDNVPPGLHAWTGPGAAGWVLLLPALFVTCFSSSSYRLLSAFFPFVKQYQCFLVFNLLNTLSLLLLKSTFLFLNEIAP
jgi:hypothetical protein